jgi:hypothetical protein
MPGQICWGSSGVSSLSLLCHTNTVLSCLRHGMLMRFRSCVMPTGRRRVCRSPAGGRVLGLNRIQGVQSMPWRQNSFGCRCMNHSSKAWICWGSSGVSAGQSLSLLCHNNVVVPACACGASGYTWYGSVMVGHCNGYNRICS